MKTDPIPTFRKAAHWMLVWLRRVNLRKILVGTVAVLIGIAAVGEMSALTTRSACEKRVRQKLTTAFGLLEWDDVRWYPPNSLRQVELPADHFDRMPEAHYGSSRTFRPRIAYVPESSLDSASADSEDGHFAWVRPAAAMPYVVRVHYSWGVSSSASRRRAEGLHVPPRHSRFSYGVVTYLAAFGLSFEIDHWATGN